MVGVGVEMERGGEERATVGSQLESERGRKGGRREWNLVGIRKQEKEGERRTRSAAPERA